MQRRNLGRSGLAVSIVGLGCNNFGGRLDREGSIEVVHAALDLGITLFDTADMYPRGSRGASEEILGEALGARRKDIVLATKFGMAMDDAGTLQGASRRYILSSVEGSLRRLKTDWIDLYQVHQPDPLTPIEESVRALDDLVRQGKVRYVGCSNFTGWQAVDALWTAKHLGLNGFIACQNQYSLLARDIERELFPALAAHGLGLLPFYPLASGLLSGKYKRNAAPPAGTRLAQSKPLQERFFTDANLATVEKLAAFCAKRGRTLLELAFSWLLARPCVASVIAGATSPRQLELNVKAPAWELTPDDLAEIDRLTVPPQPLSIG